MRTHLLIPDTTATLFVTLLWGKTFQLEQHCLIKEVHALSSFIAEDAIFDFFPGQNVLAVLDATPLITVCFFKDILFKLT